MTPGARNLSGASRNEIASTMPSQMKVAAIATRELASTAAAYDRGRAILGPWTAIASQSSSGGKRQEPPGR